MLAMGGGLLVNGSRCWAEARPLVICTVADCSVVLSASVTVAPLSITTAVEAPSPLASFQVVAPAVSVTTGRGSVGTRSEERRVGEECRSRGLPDHLKKKMETGRCAGGLLKDS